MKFSLNFLQRTYKTCMEQKRIIHTFSLQKWALQIYHWIQAYTIWTTVEPIKIGNFWIRILHHTIQWIVSYFSVLISKGKCYCNILRFKTKYMGYGYWWTASSEVTVHKTSVNLNMKLQKQR
jgi:hypothetical protein